jgi:hypothetical protein
LTRADDIARLLLICDEPETSGRDVAAALTAGLTLGLDRLAPRRGPAHGSSVRSLSLSMLSRLSVSLFSFLILCVLPLYSRRAAAAPCSSCHGHALCTRKPPPPLNNVDSFSLSRFLLSFDCPPIFECPLCWVCSGTIYDAITLIVVPRSIFDRAAPSL